MCQSRITKTCSKNVAEGLKLVYSELEKCVASTFEGSDFAIDDNSVLREASIEW